MSIVQAATMSTQVVQGHMFERERDPRAIPNRTVLRMREGRGFSKIYFLLLIINQCAWA